MPSYIDIAGFILFTFLILNFFFSSYFERRTVVLLVLKLERRKKEKVELLLFLTSNLQFENMYTNCSLKFVLMLNFSYFIGVK